MRHRADPTGKMSRGECSSRLMQEGGLVTRAAGAGVERVMDEQVTVQTESALARSTEVHLKQMLNVTTRGLIVTFSCCE